MTANQAQMPIVKQTAERLRLLLCCVAVVGAFTIAVASTSAVVDGASGPGNPELSQAAEDLRLINLRKQNEKLDAEIAALNTPFYKSIPFWAMFIPIVVLALGWIKERIASKAQQNRSENEIANLLELLNSIKATIDRQFSQAPASGVADPLQASRSAIVSTLTTADIRALLQDGQVSYAEKKDLAETLGQRGLDAVPEILEDIANADVSEQMRLVDALVTMGEAAVPQLVEALQSPSEQVREAAASALGRAADGAVVPELLQAFAREDKAGAVHSMASAIGRLGDAGAVPALIALLQKRSPYHGWNAARALGGIGPDARAAVPALIDALQDDSFSVKWPLCDALASIGDPRAIPALTDYLKTVSNDWSGAQPPIRALARFGEGAVAAVPVLVREYEMKFIALDAIQKIGSGAIPALIDALADENWAVRLFAIRALEQFGAVASCSESTLESLCQDPSEPAQVRAAAQEALPLVSGR